MPELKHFNDINFTKVDVDWSSIKFKDRMREKQRQASIARRALEPPKPQPVVVRKQANEAWSDKKAKKEKRVERREKKDRKRQAISKAKEQQEEPSDADSPSEEDDLDDDYRALKREKKQKRMGKGFCADLEDSDDSE